MKKFVLVLIIATVVAAGAFAQFSMGASIHADTGTYPAVPTIDFEYSLDKISIMWGATFVYASQTVSGGGSSTTRSSSSFVLYGGPSFNVATAGQWSVYIPLLLWVAIYDANSGQDWGLTIEPGIRAKYAFNKNWSIYTGFGIEFIDYVKENSNVSDLRIMGGANVVLGFMYKFGK